MFDLYLSEVPTYMITVVLCGGKTPILFEVARPVRLTVIHSCVPSTIKHTGVFFLFYAMVLTFNVNLLLLLYDEKCTISA